MLRRDFSAVEGYGQAAGVLAALVQGARHGAVIGALETPHGNGVSTAEAGHVCAVRKRCAGASRRRVRRRRTLEGRKSIGRLNFGCKGRLTPATRSGDG